MRELRILFIPILEIIAFFDKSKNEFLKFIIFFSFPLIFIINIGLIIVGAVIALFFYFFSLVFNLK